MPAAARKKPAAAAPKRPRAVLKAALLKKPAAALLKKPGATLLKKPAAALLKKPLKHRSISEYAEGDTQGFFRKPAHPDSPFAREEARLRARGERVTFERVMKRTKAVMAKRDGATDARADFDLHSKYAKELFRNERIVVYDLRLPPGAPAVQICIQTKHPQLRWQVGAGLCRQQRIQEYNPFGRKPLIDYPSKELHVTDKQVFFYDTREAIALQNLGCGVFRQIVFEFQTPPKYTEQQVDRRLHQALYPTNVGTELLLENEYCRVWDFYLDPGEGGGPKYVHHHVLDYVFVYVAHGRLLGQHADGTPGLFDSVNEDNDVTWTSVPENAPRSRKWAHGGKNGYKDRPMREYLVELK